MSLTEEQKENNPELFSLYNQIELLAKMLEEKRSDITDILNKILNGEEWYENMLESRYIIRTVKTPKCPKCNAEGFVVKAQYDTLTTLLETQVSRNEVSEEWTYGDETYMD